MEDGTVVVRVTFDAPRFELAGEPIERCGQVAKAWRSAMDEAGFVWPMRRVVAWCEVTGARVGWEDRWNLAGCVALAAAVGQILARDVPSEPLSSDLSTPEDLLWHGFGLIRPRRQMDRARAAAAVAEWDRCVRARLDVDAARREVRRRQAFTVREMLASGFTRAEVASLTGRSDDWMWRMSKPVDT